MGRGALSMGARDLGRGLFRFAAVAVLMLAGALTAAWPSTRRSDIQARATPFRYISTTRRVRPHETFHCLLSRPLCQVAGSAGVDSRIASPRFLDLTPAELAKQVHELKHLDSANSQDLLPMILKRVGATVTDFFNNFSNTTCTERISSTVLGAPERDPLHLERKLNYVALLRPGRTAISLQEYRTNSKGEPARSLGTIVTSGFVSLISYFHPTYQSDSRFRYLGRELVKGKKTYVIAFAQLPGVARQAEEVKLGGKTGFVLLQGVAWIDPVRFRILRLWTELEQPELSLGLQKETTQVEYSEVAFKRDRKTLWLPREVTVSGQLEKFDFSNQHRYSQYRLFIVEAKGNPKTSTSSNVP